MVLAQSPLASGVLIVDKPQGVTSHDVVGAVRRALHMRRVGHAGTLDPMATGVLVIGFGHATRLLNAIVDHRKTYEATIRFGQRTTTDDADGEFVHSAHPIELDTLHEVTFDRLQAVIERAFLGVIQQVPNAFSAIKVHGKRAYEAARQGEAVQLQPREVTIDEFTVVTVQPAQAADGTPVVDACVRVTCSAGTYIRALARDLGNEFGVGAHVTRLRRLAVGAFSVDDPRVLRAHAQERVFTDRNGEERHRMQASFEHPESVCDSALDMVDAVRLTMPVLAVDDGQALDLRFGRQIAMSDTDVDRNRGPWAAVYEQSRDVVAIVDRGRQGMVRPMVVFPQD